MNLVPCPPHVGHYGKQIFWQPGSAVSNSRFPASRVQVSLHKMHCVGLHKFLNTTPVRYGVPPVAIFTGASSRVEHNMGVKVIRVGGLSSHNGFEFPQLRRPIRWPSGRFQCWFGVEHDDSIVSPPVLVDGSTPPGHAVILRIQLSV